MFFFFLFFLSFFLSKSVQCENSCAVLKLTLLWADSAVDKLFYVFLIFYSLKIGFNQGDSLHEMWNSIFWYFKYCLLKCLPPMLNVNTNRCNDKLLLFLNSEG